MASERAAQVALWVAATVLGLVVAASALVPGRAWSGGTAGIARAPVLLSARVLHARTGLSVTPREGGVFVSTGDGGGVGVIDGFDAAPLRVRAAWFRGESVWEIGTEPGRPASYIDDNGIRRDDGMLDRLRARAWPLPASLVVAALVALALTRRRPPDRTRLLAPALVFLAALALAVQLA